MSTVRGAGRRLGAIGTTSNLVGLVDVWPVDSAAEVPNDWFFPPGPPPAVKIPYTWLSPPLRSRPDKPLTTAAVTGSSGITAAGQDDASLDEYGDNPFSATLNTTIDADLTSLVNHMLAYYATQPGDVPRARFPALRLRLNGRTQPEQWRILACTIGTRIEITDTPANWPAGAEHQVIEGIHHSRSEAADVEWNTAPVIGSSAGVAGPWFRLGVSVLGGTDALPF